MTPTGWALAGILVLPALLWAQEPPGPPAQPTAPAAAPASDSTECWYSIRVGTRHVGFLRLAVSPGEEGAKKIVADWEGPYRLLFLLSAIPWVDPVPRDRNLMIVSVRSELVVDEPWMPKEARESATVRESSIEVASRRGDGQWTLDALFSGRERQEGRLMESGDPLRWGLADQLLAAGAGRRLAPGLRFPIGWARSSWSPGARLVLFSWPEAGRPASGTLGGPEAIRLPGKEQDTNTLPVSFNLRWPSEREEFRITLWTEPSGWLARLHVELPANLRESAPGETDPPPTSIVVEREANERAARGGKEPFSRDGREDPFNRYVCVAGLAPGTDGERPDRPPPPGALPELIAQRDVLRREFADARQAGYGARMREILQQMEGIVKQVEAIGAAAAAELPEFRLLLEEMKTDMGWGNVALLAAGQFHEQAKAALGRDPPNLPLAESAHAELVKLANDPKLLGFPAEQAQVRRLEAEVGQLHRKTKVLREILPILEIGGTCVQWTQNALWEEIDLRILGLRARWGSFVDVAMPKGYAILNGVVVQEGEEVRIQQLSAPIRIVRVNERTITVAYQGEEVEIDKWK